MDHILFWNGIALEANRRDFTFIPTGMTKPTPEQGGPTRSSRALAIIHLAMYDAHAAVVGGAALPRYLAVPAVPAGPLNPADAVAGAAYFTLKALFPRQLAESDAALLIAGHTPMSMDPGFQFGLAVGAEMINDRAGDPSASDAGYTPSIGRYHHRTDPIAQVPGFHAPFYGSNSKCFAVDGVRSNFDLADPMAQPSEYLASVKQVRGKGIAPELMGTLPTGYAARTPEETVIGLFWAHDGPPGLGTPPRLYNQIVRQVAKEKSNTVDQNARLFALVNAAMGDAGILAWEQKYKWDLWRPVVGIREHDTSMGPDASSTGAPMDIDCDPEWRPLGAPDSRGVLRMGESAPAGTPKDFTPPFPAYPSGHATFGAAALHMTRLFYNVPVGDRKKDALITGSFISEETNGQTKDAAGSIRASHARIFKKGLWQMIEENGFSRVYLGVHWSLDAFALKASGSPDYEQMVGGVPLGLKIAESIWTFGNKKGPKKSTI